MPAALVDAFSDHAARYFFVVPVDLLTAHRLQQPGGAR
jgi:hypothetical protein